jgi:hypothetical protein
MYVEAESRYREIVWLLECRGAMGESVLGTCLLQHGRPAHRALVRRLLQQFPKLVNDPMLSEDYYGMCAEFRIIRYSGTNSGTRGYGFKHPYPEYILFPQSLSGIYFRIPDSVYGFRNRVFRFF